MDEIQIVKACMNTLIINNLYKFWKHIGKLNDRLIETERYLAVSIDNSDWPNRVFDIQKGNAIPEEIKKLSRKNKLPEKVTIAVPVDLIKDQDIVLVREQRNMALNMESVPQKLPVSANIKRVKTEKDSILFANVASKSFGYTVGPDVIYKMVKNSGSSRFFIYKEGDKGLGCGIIFFDSNENAGLHMIGTIPEGRGKGIGKSMTIRLIFEAKEMNVKACVLQASSMGEPIYAKFGFKSYGKLKTYQILK